MIDLSKLPASITSKLPKISTVVEDVKNAFNSGVNQVKEGVNQAGYAKNPLQLFEGSLKMGAGAVNSALAPIAPVTKPISNAVNALGNKIGDIKAVQKFADTTAGKITSRVAEDVSNLSTIAGAAGGVEAAAGKLFRRPWSLPEDAQVAVKQAYDLTQKNGGATINLKGEIPSEGFSVATSKATERIIPQLDFGLDHLTQYARENWKALQDPNAHIGTWIDNGQVYMDVPSVFKNQVEAVKAAIKADQLGIFDLSKFETIGKDLYEKIISDDASASRGVSRGVLSKDVANSAGKKIGGPAGKVKRSR